MGPQGSKESIDPLEQAIINDPLIFIGVDFVLALESLLVDLILLCTDKGFLVDIWVDFDI